MAGIYKIRHRINIACAWPGLTENIRVIDRNIRFEIRSLHVDWIGSIDDAVENVPDDRTTRLSALVVRLDAKVNDPWRSGGHNGGMVHVNHCGCTAVGFGCHTTW